MFDAGIFIMINLIGFAGLFLPTRFGAVIKLVGAIGFFSASVIMFATEDVAFVQATEDGSGDTINQTKYLIGGNEESTSDKIILGWIYLILGLFSVALFFYLMISSGGV